MDKLLAILDIPPTEQSGDQFKDDLEKIKLWSKVALQSTFTVLAITAILPVETFSDVWWDMILLMWSQARKRDREKLISYDDKMSMKALTLAQNGVIGKNIWKEKLDKIDTELKKLGFVELNKSWWSYIVPLMSANYEEILTMYWNINTLYKRIHRWKKWYKNDLEDVWSEYIVKDDLRKKETIAAPERESIQKVVTDLQWVAESIFQGQKKELRWNAVDWLVFTNDYRDFAATVWQIQDEYNCAIWIKNECDSVRKSTIQESWDNTKWRTSDIQKSMKMFAEARARLQWTFGKWDQKARDAAKQREEALLNSIYGGEIPEKSAWWKIADAEVDLDIENQSQDVRALWKWIQKSYKAWVKSVKQLSADDISMLWKSLVQWHLLYRLWNHTLSVAPWISNLPQEASQNDPNKYDTKESKKAAMDQYKQEVITTRWLDQEIELQWTFAWQKREGQTDLIRNVFTDVFVMQQSREQELVFQDVRSATTLFPKLSASVRKNKKLWWDKNEPDDNDSSIYNSAWKICELQCSNIQWKCWYHTN
jgi:hypothetical protein